MKKVSFFNYIGSQSLKSATACAFSLCCLTFALLLSISAQTAVKHTDNKKDKTLRGDARVNPTTLGMEFSLPLASFPGRAGNDVSVVMNYSSKVWSNTFPRNYPSYVSGPRTWFYPRYAYRSGAGWTSSLGIPRIDDKPDIYSQNESYGDGQPYSLSSTPDSGDPNYPLYYVKKLQVVMPDGSAHEFRKDDGIHVCGSTQSNGCSTDLTGTFLSVDGSRMRLDTDGTTATLYLPDGARYIFPQAHNSAQETVHIDGHGNKMTYNPTSKQWTDTLGRTIVDPLPIQWSDESVQAEGLRDIIVPGLNGGTQTFRFLWEALSVHQSDLAYTSQYFCNHQNFQTTQVPGANLFGQGETRVCSRSVPFNPVILREIRLPDGTRYKFSYNKYGEIEKIDYPTGGYEKIVYDYVAPVASTADMGYDQFNRGVKERRISVDGTSAGEKIIWKYDFERQTTQTTSGPYSITITAPDETYTKQWIHDEWKIGAYPYGFGN